jgi:hypothetical protein
MNDTDDGDDDDDNNDDKEHVKIGDKRQSFLIYISTKLMLTLLTINCHI